MSREELRLTIARLTIEVAALWVALEPFARAETGLDHLPDEEDVAVIFGINNGDLKRARTAYALHKEETIMAPHIQFPSWDDREFERPGVPFWPSILICVVAAFFIICTLYWGTYLVGRGWTAGVEDELDKRMLAYQAAEEAE
jgi:hypothetical protein